MSAAEVFPPGEFLKEELEARNWSQTEFAEIIGRPVRLINEIIAGKKSVTPETAGQLGASLGTSAELWMNLETRYQLSKVQQADSGISRKAKLHERFPVREMTRRKWIEETKDVEHLEEQLRTFFSLDNIDDELALAHAAKKSASYAMTTMLQWSWLYRARQLAAGFAVKKYSRDALLSSLDRLRSVMTAPEEVGRVPVILNDAGVRFVVVEALPNSKIDGACLWLEGAKPVIAVSTRLDRIDNFWFVLRHEIEHLLQEHGKEAQMMLDEDICGALESSLDTEEQMANAAAAEFAVSDAELSHYMARVNPYFFAEDRVLGFADRLGVHPGIVVGRLQKKLEQQGHPNPYKFLRGYLVKIRSTLAQYSPTDGWGTSHPIS